MRKKKKSFSRLKRCKRIKDATKRKACLTKYSKKKKLTTAQKKKMMEMKKKRAMAQQKRDAVMMKKCKTIKDGAKQKACVANVMKKREMTAAMHKKRAMAMKRCAKVNPVQRKACLARYSK
jgi:hypothetical protein